MIIGMTGTRDGMTEAQKTQFKKGLLHLKAITLHHGDCVGADADAHNIADKLRHLDIVIHPPISDKFRAFKNGPSCTILAEKIYFARNRDIVNESEILIGTPRSMVETKGGTWYTINYGKKSGKRVYIIHPDGNVERHN